MFSTSCGLGKLDWTTCSQTVPWWENACQKKQTAVEPRKKKNGPYFPLNPGGLIGILIILLIMVYYNPHFNVL